MKETHFEICLYCNQPFDTRFTIGDEYCSYCHEKLFGSDHE